MRRPVLSLALSVLLVVSPIVPGSATVAQSNAVPSQLVLQDGTPVRLRLNHNVSSADATVGESVDFEVLDEVSVNGIIVIPKGSTAIGTVTEAVPKRRMARGGKLEIVLDYVRLADTEKAAVRAVKDAKGGGHTGGMTAGIVATGLIFWPAAPFFLFMHGKDITVPKGAEVVAYVNGDQKLSAAKFPPATTDQSQTSAAAPASSGPAIGSVPNTSAPGSIYVHSNPDSAEVYVDGSLVGDTPATVKLNPGHHTIRVVLTGYKEWSRDLTVQAGWEAHLAAVLERNELTGEVQAASTATADSSKKVYTVKEVPPTQADHKNASQASLIGVETPSGWIGAETKRTTNGAKIVSVAPDGPAAQAGLKVGDEIQAINGRIVRDEDFEAEIVNFKPGTGVVISYMRSAWARETLVIVGKNRM